MSIPPLRELHAADKDWQVGQLSVEQLRKLMPDMLTLATGQQGKVWSAVEFDAFANIASEMFSRHHPEMTPDAVQDTFGMEHVMPIMNELQRQARAAQLLHAPPRGKA
jgi:hypothetical protein